MLVYRIRPDGVFDKEVEVPDGPTIPSGHTRTAPPPIPLGSHAVMRAGWQIVLGEAPPYGTSGDLSAENIREERNARLTACDWTQLDDTPLSNTAKAAWAAYRQALRDIPAQEGFPQNVVWPSAPGE